MLVTRANSYSFPSVHAAAATAAICGLLLARRWRLAALAVVFGGLLLFSRVYVGAQYPGDVVGGAVLGVVVSLGLWPAARWALGQVTAWAAAGPLGQIVVAKGAPRASRKGLRRRSSQRPAQRLPDARAMDALRAASEAARAAGHHPVVPGPTPLGQGFQLKPGGGQRGSLLPVPWRLGQSAPRGARQGTTPAGAGVARRPASSPRRVAAWRSASVQPALGLAQAAPRSRVPRGSAMRRRDIPCGPGRPCISPSPEPPVRLSQPCARSAGVGRRWLPTGRGRPPAIASRRGRGGQSL